MNNNLSYDSDLYELAYYFSIAWIQFHFDISIDQSEEILSSGNNQQNNFLHKNVFNKNKKQKLNSEEAEKINQLLIDITQEKDITKIIIDLGEVAKNSSNLSELFEEAEDFYYEKQQKNGIQLRGARTLELDSSQTTSDLEERLSVIANLNKMLYGDVQSDTRKSINQLRKLSGLSWEKIANLFDVPLKTTYFWASGRQINSKEDVEKLYQLLDSIKYINRGNSSLNRNILLKTLSDGMLPFDLLVAGKFQEFKSILGAGTPLKRPELSPLSEESHKLRKPISLENIVDARQETIHKSV